MGKFDLITSMYFYCVNFKPRPIYANCNKKIRNSNYLVCLLENYDLYICSRQSWHSASDLL